MTALYPDTLSKCLHGERGDGRQESEVGEALRRPQKAGGASRQASPRADLSVNAPADNSYYGQIADALCTQAHSVKVLLLAILAEACILSHK